jgi:hypothetical protein
MVVREDQRAAEHTWAKQESDGRNKMPEGVCTRRPARFSAEVVLPKYTSCHRSRQPLFNGITRLPLGLPIILLAASMCSCVSIQKFRIAQEEANMLRAENVGLTGYVSVLHSQNETLVYRNETLRDELNTFRKDCEKSQGARYSRGGALALQADLEDVDYRLINMPAISDQWSRHNTVSDTNADKPNRDSRDDGLDRRAIPTLATTAH